VKRSGPDDAVLRALGVDPTAVLGRGGEATVFALDDERVVRLLRHPDLDGVQRRRALVAELLTDGLGQAHEAAFVHLDVCPANVLTDGTRITAVLDIGATAVVGDAAMDALTAAVHLAAPEITPTVRPGDVVVARSWLRSAGLDGRYEPARRWLAAYWSFATDDRHLQGWCRSVLGTGAAPA
jgi:aminoglycoside phosphotransferase (APT) family kinase protein